ncbi:hypothetical protein G3A39_38405 [Paraburkholderia aspalathi]|nr:hypothetical protein [Paraburkholderia aspalathi]
MPNSVWVSSVMSDHSIGDKQGIREKYFDGEWAQPTFNLGLAPKRIFQAHMRHMKGEKVQRDELPEAMYVFAETNWKRCGDLFFAGPFYAVKGKLAEVLKGFDLGEGGLIELPIYEADKTTMLPGPFYFLNFGAIKNSMIPQESNKLYPRRTLESDGYERWATYTLRDDDIAVGVTALEGADLWFDPKLENRIFMSGRLHDAILEAKVKTNFRFAKAKII